MVSEEESEEKENSKDMSISQNSKIDNIKIFKKREKNIIQETLCIIIIL